MRERILPLLSLVAVAAVLTACTPSDAGGADKPQKPAADGLSTADFPVVDGKVVSDTGQDGNHTIVLTTDENVVLGDAVALFEDAGYTIDESSDEDYVDRIAATSTDYTAEVTIAGTTATYVFTAVE